MHVVRHFRFAPTLLAAACVAPATPPAPASPPAAARPAPPPPRPVARPAEWRDWPLTPGTWHYRDEGPARTVASFGTGPAAEVARLICDRPARRIQFQAAGAAAGTPLTVRTSSITRALPVTLAGQPGIPTAALAATDPLLDAMAFSRGRFTLEPAGAPALVVPAYAEIGRVIEDCRG